MPIQALSNQWKTYDDLLNRFAALPHNDSQGDLAAKNTMMRELLTKLHGSCDSVVYVGTSHGTMNFGTRDTKSNTDRTQPFAFVDVVIANKTPREYAFRIETREIDRNKPTSKWIVCEITDSENAAKIVREALKYADVPQRRN